MFVTIPIKTKLKKKELRKIDICDLSDPQLKISIDIYESKTHSIYNQIRAIIKLNNNQSLAELNFKAVFTERILHELYLERTFREKDSVVLLNKLFDDIYSSQVNDEGIENSIKRYECNTINSSLEPVNMHED